MRFQPKPKTIKRTIKVNSVIYGRKVFFLLQIASMCMSAYMAYRLLW